MVSEIVNKNFGLSDMNRYMDFKSLIIVIVGFQNFVCLLLGLGRLSWSLNQTKQQNKNKLKNNNYKNQLFKLQLSTVQARRQKKPPQDLLKMLY